MLTDPRPPAADVVKRISIALIIAAVLFALGSRCIPEPDPAWREIPR